MIAKTDFNGDLTTFEYNNLYQLIKVTFADNTSVISTYTEYGKVASITKVEGTTHYQYDAQDRLKRIDYPDGNFIAYLYDLNGNRIQVKTSNQTVDYGYDELNRLSTVNDINGTTRYTYDAVGNRRSQVNANAVVTRYEYDSLNRLVNLEHKKANGDVIADYRYTLGASGNRQRIEESTGRIVDYTYDDLYRLLTEEIIDPVNGNHLSEFVYDAVGNRLQQLNDGIITTYSYNNNDQLLSENRDMQIIDYSYDNNGNMLTKSLDGIIDTNYTYNKENQMISVVNQGNNIQYQYDASGTRNYQNINGVETNYLIDPNRAYAQVLEEQNNLFIPEVTYTYGDDLISQINDQGTHTFGYDGLGSTRILTNNNGVVENAYGYEAFGELDYQLGTIENNYLFTGEQYDNNIGFYYLRARYYNPNTGTFTQMDTYPGMQFEPLTLHKYLYTANNPVNFIDPSGHSFISGLATATRVLGTLAAYGYAAYNIIARVENGIAIYQGVGGLYAAWNKIQSAGYSFNIPGDDEFNEAMQNWDNAIYVLSKNMGKIFFEMAGHKSKRDEVQQFVRNDNTLMLIYGPTPNHKSDWFPLNNRVKIGRLSIGKRKRNIMLELGRKSKTGGRMVGMGHSFKKAKTENTQWWRMDYHNTEGHSPDSNDWEDSGYHFHVKTAGNNK